MGCFRFSTSPEQLTGYYDVLERLTWDDDPKLQKLRAVNAEELLKKS